MSNAGMPKRRPAFLLGMSSARTDTWPRRIHSALRPLADNLWLVDGPVPGLPAYRRQMVVARDEQARLLVHSAIALNEASMAQLEALGAPTWLVVPNGYHRLDAPAYKQRYPQLCVVTPRGSLTRVQQVVRVDLTYDEFPASKHLQLAAAPWPHAAEGFVKVHSSDGATLVWNDLLWTPSSFVHRLMRQQPHVPWLARQLYARGNSKQTALHDWLQQLALTPQLHRVIPGHGAPILHDASTALQRVAAPLKGSTKT